MEKGPIDEYGLAAFRILIELLDKLQKTGRLNANEVDALLEAARKKSTGDGIDDRVEKIIADLQKDRLGDH